MALKRQQPQALSIFNKNKRPRLALVAHPGNTEHTSIQVPGNVWSNTKPQYSSHSSVRSSYQQQENYNYQPPAKVNRSYHINHQPQLDNYSSSYQNRSYSGQQAQKYSTPQVNYSQSRPLVQRNVFTPYQKPNQQFAFSTSNPAVTKPQSITSVGDTATGHAYEPGISHSAQSGRTVTVKDTVTSKPAKSKPSLRLLTATAQGMRHWAQYKTNSPLLFEIFGTLLSPGVTSVNSNCKQFSIKTPDGPVSCQFWEIDRPLPSLTVSRGYRVVGDWDTRDNVMKCYSVRSVRVGEVEGAGQAVKRADRAMRKFVNTLHES